jgi:hypothetical protein
MSAFFNRGRLRRFETLYLPGEQERIIGFSGYVTRPPQPRRDTPRRIAFGRKQRFSFIELAPQQNSVRPIRLAAKYPGPADQQPRGFTNRGGSGHNDAV